MRRRRRRRRRKGDRPRLEGLVGRGRLVRPVPTDLQERKQWHGGGRGKHGERGEQIRFRARGLYVDVAAGTYHGHLGQERALDEGRDGQKLMGWDKWIDGYGYGWR